MDNQVHWKSVWQMVSGLHQDTPKDKVKAKLIELREELKEGLLHFKPCNNNSDADLAKLLKGQEKLLPLTKYLQKYLNLDAKQTWSTLCTYLVNEYKGSPSSLAVFVSNETNKWKLVTDIWNYYSLDRMIILKLIKNLLEFQREKRHPYQTVYAEILDNIGLRALKDKIIDQLTTSLKDDVEYQSVSILEQQHEIVKLDLLFTRKLREINELIQILVLIGHTEGQTSPEELNMLLNTFKNSAFLQKCKYQSEGNIGMLLQKIEHSRVILLLLFINNCPPNTSTWNSKVLKDIDEVITSSHQLADSGPILLAWMVKNLKTLSLDETLSDSINSRSYQQCGAKAIKLDVFKYLLTILTSKTFQNKPPNLLAIVARQLVYNILNEMCDLFDADGSVGHYNFVYDLVAELLTTSSIAVDYMKRYNEDSSRGCVSLYNTAIELFPVTMIPISKIASALATSGTKSGSEFIKSQLEKLPVYTELCTGNQYDLQPIDSEQAEDEFLLTKDYFPMRKFNYKIPRSTRVAMTDRRKVTYVHFWSPCNYFQVLHNDIQILLSMGMAGDSQSSDENVQLTSRVTWGVQYLRDMLKKLKNPSDITDSMVHPVEMVFDILLKFKTLPHPPVDLLSSCLEVCTALSSFFHDEVLRRMLNLDIFPSVSSHSLSYEEYARGAAFDSGLIGQYLINFENASGRYPFLKAYFGFLKAYKSKNKENVFPVELPGLIFLLREIFPHCHTWRFERESDLHEIYTFVMEFFFELLQSEDQTVERILLRNTCVYSLLNLENGLTLLKFVGIGNPFLQSKMESESNWVAAVDSGLNTIVQLSMTILMQILRKKWIISGDQGSNSLSPLETIIYTQPKQRDTLRIIPVVTSYMNNIFNRRLPILSCRLLRRFAIEFQMSLLACLDMEQDHIRMIFLQRLRDESGSNELKIAILEFVEACLDKQPGLVEAFFDIQYDSEKKKPKMHTEGIPAYMEEYLEAVAKEPEKVASPLLSRIMSLFHVVWRNNMQSLIGNLIENKTFWPSLCKPLFVTINIRSLKVYSQLFNILGLEVFKYQDNDLSPELESTLKKFLELNSFETWLKYLLDSDLEEVQVSTDETPEWLCRMQSFKDFLCIVLKKKPQLISSKARCVLLNRLVIEILKRIEETQLSRSDSRSMVILTELYLLVLVGNETKKYTDNAAEDKRLFHDIASILSFLASSYEDVIPRVREAILGFAVEISLAYNDELSAYPEIGTHFIQSTLAIISQELSWIEHGITDGQPKAALLLALNLLRKLLLINNEARFFDWEPVSMGHKILYRFLGTLSKITQQHADRKVTLEILDVLTIIPRTLETNDFLYCDVGDYLWLKLLPPKSLLKDPFKKSKQKLTEPDWTIQEWWPIYEKGIELVTVLLHKHGCLFVQQAITFLGIHEEYLMDSMNLVRESLEPRAMELIKKTVGLICECAKYRKTWQLEHSQSICNLMRSIQILTEQLISLLYRPNLLKMLLENDNALVDLSAPISATPELIKALNGVIEIIISCIKALMCFTPPLMELLCSPTFTPTQWHVLIEIQFGAPKFNDSVQPLSFGTLLSAAGTFTKALSLMHYNCQETPLNFENDEDCEKDMSVANATTSKSKTTNMSTTRAIYNKTLSVSSYGNQTMANCNEIFSNLDGKLCVVALEYIYTLVISQSLLAIKDVHLSVREKQLIRRELGAELSKLNDFLKHKLSLDKVGSLQRKKYGASPILNIIEDVEETNKAEKPPASSSQRRLSQPRDSMRVNVVRKLHLKQKVLPVVQGSTPRKDDNQPATPFDNLTPIKRTCFDDTEYLNIEDPTDVGLSMVKIVEEDYLHMLSNVLTVVCHSDK